MILRPLLRMLPDLRSFTVPAHNAVCPRPSITLFDRQITVTSHCELAEQFRAKIYAVFVVVFALGALFIVLMA
ncbi:hypothetical protein AQ477_14320 [Burkholderia thailandensis]|nr:hypothetical protein AQ477_14320 [Burkholderia thailandensis]KXF61562.1 hypothetical protein AQ476_09800 [Burkholderia thailandensis]PNE74353.1 hypothetical protein A8H37_21335 [Burkholderia thailandensis]